MKNGKTSFKRIIKDNWFKGGLFCVWNWVLERKIVRFAVAFRMENRQFLWYNSNHIGMYGGGKNGLFWKVLFG